MESPLNNPDDIKTNIVEILKTCYDPEIPVNIYELGLIYNIDVGPTGAVELSMTLTSPACPVAGSLPPDVENKVKSVPGVTAAKVTVVWDPPWKPEMMSEAARLQLGML
ncbi:MAG: SUF system Fe-S cluster assembly protein [Deltaproteobacteria bacterium]|nr:SUF system Fe-S cluster assembly protein [Deltaproteobacteria bacterium]